MQDTNKPLAVPHPPMATAPMPNGHLPMDASTPRGQLALTGPGPMMSYMPAAPTPTGPNAAPSLNTMLQALRRRWVPATLLAVVGAILTVMVVMWLFPARFVAVAAVRIRSTNVKAIIDPGAQVEDPEFALVKLNMQAWVKKPIVLSTALTSIEGQVPNFLQAHPDASRYLETAIKTDFKLGPEVMQITLAGDDPREITLILDAVIKSFLANLDEKERDRKEDLLRNLKTSRSRMDSDLNLKKQALRKALETRKMEDPEVLKVKFQVAQTNVQTVGKQALDAELALRRAQEELSTLEKREKNFAVYQFPESVMDAELERDPEGRVLMDSIADVLKTIQRVKSTSTNPDQAIAPYVEKRIKLQRQLNELRTKMKPDIEEKIRKEALEQLRFEIEKTKEKIRQCEGDRKTLVEVLKRAEEDADKCNPGKQVFSPEVDRLRNEVERTEASMKLLDQRIGGIEAEPAQSGRVDWWLKPDEPKDRDHSRQIKMAGTAGLGMFAFILMGVAYLEFRQGKISGPDEVHSSLGMNLVGTVPSLPDKARRATQGGAKQLDPLWQNQLNEAIDGIRTMLLHAARSENLHVVMIASAMGGEGKTSLASQLAASLARAWRKTLLIDGDLRNPAAHQLFSMPLEPGFSEVLRNEVNAAEAVRPTPMSRLWLMSAGQWDHHAVQALAQDSVRTLFESLKQQYDFIIVDSSPVLPVADALSLAQHVDGVVFSILRDVSRAPAVYAAQQKFQSLNVRTLGAVVIGAKNDLNLNYAYGSSPKG